MECGGGDTAVALRGASSEVDLGALLQAKGPPRAAHSPPRRAFSLVSSDAKCAFEHSASESGIIAIQTLTWNRFADVRHGDAVAAGEVGDGAGHFRDAAISAGGSNPSSQDEVWLPSVTPAII